MTELLPGLLLPGLLLPGLLLGAPLLGALALALLGLRAREPGEPAVAALAEASLSLGLLGALALALGRARGALPELIPLGSWLRAGSVEVGLGLRLDASGLGLLLLGLAMTLLTARFSRGYLHREPGFRSFYATLCLFAGALELLCLSEDALLGYAGWELSGLCSTLLIAFFRERPAAAAAGIRAFVTLRVGDAGFLMAMVLSMSWIGGSGWSEIQAGAGALTAPQATAIGAGLLLAAAAKAGQVPLSPWVFRAMEGPTPSSALFYGAVAVHGGALLLLRAEPLIERSGPVALLVVVVGLASALYGWLVGLTQTDIKSALICSSISQLGLIFVWCGLGLGQLALAHTLAHGVVRGWQILRAPSVVDDLRAAPVRPVRGRLAQSRALYVASLSRFWLEEITHWAVVEPLRRLGRQLDAVDAHLVDRATGLPIRRAFTGLATWRDRPTLGQDASQGRGVMGRLAQWTAAGLARVEDRLVLRAIGQGIPEAGGRLGVLLSRVELLLGQPWVVALIVLAFLAWGW